MHLRAISLAYFFSRIHSGLVQNPRFVYTVELDIEECLKQKPSIKSFLSRLRDKPSKLEFSKVRWAPLDLISRLARADESSSDSGTKNEVSQENVLGQSRASTDTTRPGIGQISSKYFRLPFSGHNLCTKAAKE